VSLISKPKRNDTVSAEDIANTVALLREKSVHITKAARSATVANVLAPLLCIPAFQDEVSHSNLTLWLVYMGIVVVIRTWIVFKLPYEPEKIHHPQNDLTWITYAVGMVGFGWGLGWVLMAPELQIVNQMIYVYMTTAAMIAGMFAYSVNKPTFFAFTLPIMVPSLSTVLWSTQSFPWPFLVGLATLYLVVLSIAKNFSETFENSVRLRFRNERLYQELAAERDQSVAANVAKSKFIAVASHDLRQPMHAVNVYLELINLEGMQEQDKKSLAKIKSSIHTLNAMFDSLLNISKLDADAMQVSHRVFKLDELTTTLRDLTEAKANSKGLALHFSAPHLMVRGDKLILQQIISNLISNAIQYTEQGEIEVTFMSLNDCLTIEVRDTGCGISAVEQKDIFNQFYRADKTRALHDGLGLGLFIVQRLCTMIGADVQVASEEGRGATFTVSTAFPATGSEATISTAQVLPKFTNLHRNLQGKTIAVIEDNPIIVEAYRQTLASKGAYVQVLSENESELDAQLETIDHIDCILSDYRLSQTTGDVLIQKLRDSYNEEIPAIIVTADTTPSHINFFANLNVQVLHKPISFQEIAAAIEKTLVTEQAPS
jgi:signal transduction histidine kinase/ActR/RegA family two-component response regulator